MSGTSMDDKLCLAEHRPMLRQRNIHEPWSSVEQVRYEVLCGWLGTSEKVQVLVFVLLNLYPLIWHRVKLGNASK